MPDPKNPVDRPEIPIAPTESPLPLPPSDDSFPERAEVAPPPGAGMMERASTDFVIADGLPLQRLYARFDAIAAGLTKGNSSARHRSVIERLASNQRRATALGWTGFVLERRGGSGRLELRGRPAPGLDLELVPDAIPFEAPTPVTEGIGHPLVADLDGQIGSRRAGVAWRARMRWLDDGGR
jgi:hypothetical protein